MTNNILQKSGLANLLGISALIRLLRPLHGQQATTTIQKADLLEMHPVPSSMENGAGTVWETHDIYCYSS